MKTDFRPTRIASRIRKIFLLVLITFAYNHAHAFEVTPGMTGSWYDPSHSGEGFILQVIDESNALVYWFTYDKSGKQFWTLGTGQINGGEIRFDDMLSYRGGRFGPEFDKNDVSNQRWGSLVLSFDDCNSGTATYTNSGSFGSGTQDIQKLTSVWGFDCQGRQNSVSDNGKGLLKPGFSGSWYDFDHSGEGFTLEVIGPETALVYWFTYDTQGNPAWMVSVADIEGATIFANEVLQPVGGRFGPDFDPADVVRQPWGQAVFTFGSCKNGGMRYQGPPSYGPESVQVLNRLVSVQGADCGFLGPQSLMQGIISVAEDVYIDGDTNDLNTTFRPNNGGNQWQEIFTPAQIAGFVTFEPTGERNSRFETTADQGDLYRVVLRRGEVVALDIATSEPSNLGGDLDLYLYDISNNEEPVATSLSTSPLEKVVAPYDGEFYLWVWAFDGASNYTLRTGWDTADSASMLTVNAPMKQDEVIVKFTPGMTPGVQSGPLSQVASISDLDSLGIQLTTEIIDGIGLFNVEAPYVNMLSAYPFPLASRGFGIGDHRKWVQVVTAKRLLARSDVESAAPNYLLSSSAVPNDFLYPNQWHYRAIDLEAAWDVTTGSRNVVVAVIDSGVAPHPDLVGNVDYNLGYDFVRNSFLSPSYDGNGLDADASDPGIGYTATGYKSHGTHVAGTIGAVSNNSRDASGVAWDVTIMPLRAGANRTLGCDAILDSLRWAGRFSNSSGRVPAKAADVINMSFGGYSQCPGTEQLLTELRNRGVILIAAAGNDETSQRSYPASFAGVVSVSATDAADTLAWYSNYGGTIDIAAPGGDTSRSEFGGVWSPTGVTPAFSAAYSPEVVPLEGTSMAAPHVAGVAALMKSVNPALMADDFDYALASGALTDDLARNGEQTKDSSFGYGRINARKAVNWAAAEANNGSRETFITSSVASMDFGSDKTSLLVDVGKSGPANVLFETWYREHEYVQLEVVSTNSQAFGTYRVIVNRNGLARGNYRSTLWFEADNKSIVRINIEFQVGNSIPGEAGALYSVLLDAYTLTPMYWWNGVQGNNGYSLRYDNVVDGAYFLLTGSDMDNDFRFCDEGEFCQIYPNSTEPRLIDVSGNTVGLQRITIGAPLTNPASAAFAASLGGEDASSAEDTLFNWSELMPANGIRLRLPDKNQ